VHLNNVRKKILESFFKDLFVIFVYIIVRDLLKMLKPLRLN